MRPVSLLSQANTVQQDHCGLASCTSSPRSTDDSCLSSLVNTKKTQLNVHVYEASVSADEEQPEGRVGKRYLPDHKKPDAAATFPEKLMKLMQFAETKNVETFCVAWTDEGRSFIVRDPNEFTREVVPKFFKPTKFSSFTRKLYRWGFRQVNRGIGPNDPIVFGNEYFQRDNAGLMVKMRSITAAGQRKECHQQHQQTSSSMWLTTTGMKHPLDELSNGLDFSGDNCGHKRMMVDHFCQQQKANTLCPSSMGANNNILSQSLYPGMSSGDSFSLTKALCTNMNPADFNMDLFANTNINMNNFNNVSNVNSFQPLNCFDNMTMPDPPQSINFNQCNNDQMSTFNMLMQQYQDGRNPNGQFMMNMNMGNMGDTMNSACGATDSVMNNVHQFSLPQPFVDTQQLLEEEQQQQMFCGNSDMSAMGVGLGSSCNGFAASASTAEIVNAAIAALRFAN